LDDGVNANVKVQLFNEDYCTSGYYREFTPGTWSWSSGPVKSARVFVEQDDIWVHPGIGVKVVVFPQVNMAPLDEFTCEGDQWRDLGLQDASNAQGGDWPNACASAVDRIYCMSPTDINFQTKYGDPQAGEATSAVNELIGPPPGYIDFAGSSGPGTVAYDFGAYPVGSVFVNLYKSSWGGGDGTSGSKCGWGDGTPSYDVCTDHDHYDDYCVKMRFWEDACPDDYDWDGDGWWEVGVKVYDLCNDAVYGWCFNTYTSGPRKHGKDTIACENMKIKNKQGDTYTSWPFKVTCMYTRVVPCFPWTSQAVHV